MGYDASSWSPLLTSDGGVKYNGTSANYSDPRRASPDTVDKYLWMYVSPIIFIFGMCGNILTIAVSRRRQLSSSTAGLYLQLMAGADSLVLIFGLFPDWLMASEFVTLRDIHPWMCKLEKFLFYTTSDTAIWLLVAFTFDRFIAVCFPLKKNYVCVMKRAVIISSVILVTFIVKNLPELALRGWEYHQFNSSSEWVLTKKCGYITQPSQHYGKFIRPWIAFITVMVIPFCLIFAFNVAIVRMLLKIRNSRRSQITTSSQGRNYSQTTIMCLSASFLFLICITPSIVLLIGKPYWTDDGKGNYAYDISKVIHNQLAYINHAMNFFLYSLTGRRFREELLAMFRGEKSAPGFLNSSIYKVNPKTASTKIHPRTFSQSVENGASHKQESVSSV